MSYNEKEISRRSFLRSAGIVVITASIGAVGIEEYLKEDKISTVDLINKHPEIIDISNFRASLGLSPTPPEIKDRLTDKSVDWKIPNAEFVNSLPESIRSYGMANEYIQDLAFGQNAGRLVNEIIVKPNGSGGLGFMDNDGRKCLVPARMDYMPIVQEYPDFVLHEAIGHGSDPSGHQDIYPTDMLFKISHGKWRMLSHAFDFEGQFFNHPEDLTLPEAKKKIGEQFAINYKDKNIDGMFASRPESYKALDILNSIARERNTSPNDLKFNKSVCKELGSRLFSQISSGQLLPGKEVHEWYEPILESALVEIYAEMMKIAVMHPDLINYNTDILEGAKEILSTIKGEDADLAVIRRAAATLTPEILDRKKHETYLLNSANFTEGPRVNPNNIQPIIINEQVASVKIERGKLKKIDDDLFAFVNFGKLPITIANPSETIRSCIEYADLRAKIEHKYKGKIASYTKQEFSFDPQLHIWEIRDIESAMDIDFIRRLVVDLTENLDNINTGEIKDKSKMLKKFVTSNAFGT